VPPVQKAFVVLVLFALLLRKRIRHFARSRAA